MENDELEKRVARLEDTVEKIIALPHLSQLLLGGDEMAINCIIRIAPEPDTWNELQYLIDKIDKIIDVDYFIDADYTEDLPNVSELEIRFRVNSLPHATFIIQNIHKICHEKKHKIHAIFRGNTIYKYADNETAERGESLESE